MALIKLNRTKTGAVPTSLADGELYIDQLNGLIYYADATGAIRKFSITGFAETAANADKVDGHHAGTAAGEVMVLSTEGKVPVSADKVIISGSDPVTTQGGQNWVWLKV